jgi:thioredoxin reductase
MRSALATAEPPESLNRTTCPTPAGGSRVAAAVDPQTPSDTAFGLVSQHPPDSRKRQHSLSSSRPAPSINDMSDYDVAVIGGGAAGLSAALVLARARRTVLVVDSGSPRNAPAAHMHGFLSRDGLPPGELLALGRSEVENYGGEIMAGTVTGLAVDTPNQYVVQLGDDNMVIARRLVVATGLRDHLPDIPGLTDRWGRDVLHCPYCHGWEVRDQRLGVLGGSPDAVRYTQIVRQWSDDVIYFDPAGSLTAVDRDGLLARAIGIVAGPVGQVLTEDDRLCGLAMEDRRIIRRDAIFVPPRFSPNSDLLTDLGCDLDANGWPATDATGRSSVPGVWVAGNITNPRGQVITAAGEGSAAAIAINADLVAADVRAAIEGHHHWQPDQNRPITNALRTSGPLMRPTPVAPRPVPDPPTRHQLALMIWLAVFPTLTLINLAMGDWLGILPPLLRTFVLTTVAVPIVIYGLMPPLHKLRVQLLRRSAA